MTGASQPIAHCCRLGGLGFVGNKSFDVFSIKSIALQAWTGPESSGSFRLQDFKTSDKRKW
jgi:hypothetical protein